MADVTVDALTELTTVANDDYLPVYDTSAGALKKISRANVLNNVFLTNVAQSITAATTFTGEAIFTRSAATIASDTISAVGNCMVIDTEAAAASDDLKTINGGSTGQILILNPASTARAITVKHATGNIYLSGGADRALNHIRAHLTLICIGSEWRELAYSRNLA